MTTVSDFALIDETPETLPSFCDRFFAKFLYEKATKQSTVEDHNIFIHSNGICLVGIAESHPVFEKEIVNVNFNIGNVDRSQNAVKGKAKKGGMILQESTNLCKVECSDGTEYGIVAGIQGILVEVNPRLQKNPNLLKEGAEGYVAVILPKVSTLNSFKSKHKQM